MQSQPGYPPQGQPGYPPQGQPGYPPQAQPVGTHTVTVVVRSKMSIIFDFVFKNSHVYNVIFTFPSKFHTTFHQDFKI